MGLAWCLKNKAATHTIVCTIYFCVYTHTHTQEQSFHEQSFHAHVPHMLIFSRGLSN
jgi:hypothetical protein